MVAEWAFEQRHSALTLAARMTLLHPKSAGEPASTVRLKLASCAFVLEAARAAAGVFLGEGDAGGVDGVAAVRLL
jgi:hypothetical protein